MNIKIVQMNKKIVQIAKKLVEMNKKYFQINIKIVQINQKNSSNGPECCGPMSNFIQVLHKSNDACTSLYILSIL